MKTAIEQADQNVDGQAFSVERDIGIRFGAMQAVSQAGL